MKKILFSLLLLSLLTSCATYTYIDAKHNIAPIPSQKSILASAALIPLEEAPTELLLQQIREGVERYHFDLVLYSGERDSIASLYNQTTESKLLLDEKTLLVTAHPFTLSSDGVVTLKIGTKKLYLSSLNLYNPLLLSALEKSPLSEWDTLFPKEEIVEQRVNTHYSPFLLLASLGEPSSSDWREESSYRVAFRWPLSEYIESKGFIDAYRFSHPDSSESTWRYKEYEERIDFIYMRDLLPIECSIIPILNRSAVVATFTL